MAIPALDLLLGEEASDLLATAIAEYDCTLEDLRAAEVNVGPSGAAIVMYVAGVRRADGSHTTEYLGATTGSSIPPDAAVVAGEFRGTPVEVGIWAWPRDPGLPALPTASSPVLLAELFRTFGLSTATALEIRPRRYLPSQHAVLEVYDGRSRWFVRVVQPSAAEGLRHRHDIASPHVPVPPIVAATAEGLLVLPEAEGTPLRSLLLDGDAALPSPEALESLLDALPAELMALDPAPSHLAMVDHYANALACAAADEPAVLASLTEVVDATYAMEYEPEELVPVHGDFYEGQLLAENGLLTAMIDIDTAGPGQRSDEWATLLAHLAGLSLESEFGQNSSRYADAVLMHAKRRFPARVLHHRTAAALIGLANAPFRLRRPEWPRHTIDVLDLAMHWATKR